MTPQPQVKPSNPDDDVVSRQLAIISNPIPDSILAGIKGNAPSDVKEIAVKWLNFFNAPAEKCFYGLSSGRKVVTEVSLDADPLREGQVLTLVCELDIAEESLLDRHGKLANAFIFSVLDETVSSAVTALGYATGGSGICGVSQSLNTVFYNTVDLGAKLRFINTTLTATPETTACRCEVWDLTQRRLVATGVFIGMPSSSPRQAARL
ncbi:hypothetical protein FB45DRAFT_908711 [Roridomyces roridus]|uniref:Thioesterase domain-containing protein n=1 Tax=Roridomyces roridus TaxID=1738132 RepID=A0AAD7BYP5_9AGAR|nr:hypothetical protein FB45DRAFT_908711 [Roridomyces roridus]